MKKILLFTLFCVLIIISSTFLVLSQNVAITDDDSYTANSSAMLDIKSLSKGMLVPRLTTVQRNAVSNPATGLLVFDTDVLSFYFYNGTSWTNLSSGNASGIIGYTAPDKVYLNDINDKFGIGTISPNGKLDVKSDVSIGNEKPIFNVVNSTGDTVFAVYEQGVRINVYDDPLAKATSSKGGFAVGGFSPAKAGVTNEYLRITPDSIRLYVEDDPLAKANTSKGGFAVGGFSPAKAGFTNEYLRITPDSVRIYIEEGSADKATTSKGGFAVGGFSPAKGLGTDDYFNIYGSMAATIVDPSEARIMWYPLKEAFLAGKIIVEHADSVGLNSFSTGYLSRAKGSYSQAFGYQSVARGNYSTAIGYNALANGQNSYAFGNSAYAKDSASYAIGSGAKALGLRSFAMGSTGVDSAGVATNPTIASGNYSYAFGMGSQATNTGSFAFGTQDTAIGNYSLAMGYKTKASNWYDTAMGNHTKASGGNSTAMGLNTLAIGSNSTAMGSHTTASGSESIASGSGTIASGEVSTAMGVETIASGELSIAMGDRTIASGYSAMSMGERTIASGGYSLAMGFWSISEGDFATSMGYYTKAKPYASLAIGKYNDTTCSPSGLTSWISTDPLFIIGNGATNNTRSNAMTVLKNGNVGIGAISPSSKLEIIGDIKITDGTEGLGKVLTSDASGLASWQGLPSSGVSGSGIANYLAKFSDATTVGNSVIYDDGTNIGIGTASSGSKLEVAGNIRIPTSDILFTSAHEHGLGWYGTFFANKPFASVDVDGPVLYGYNGGALGYYTSSQNIVLRWTNSGNVGIGESSPTRKLEVNGNMRLGTNGTTIANVIKATYNVDLTGIAAGASLIQTFTVTNAQPGSSVSISPEAALNSGLIIQYARVSSANTISVRFFNASTVTIDMGAMDYYITVIE